MKSSYYAIFDQNINRLLLYSTYKFIKGADQDAIYQETVLKPWLAMIDQKNILVEKVTVDNEDHFVLIEPLQWDSGYFGFPIHKIVTVLYFHDDYTILKEAMLQFTTEISNGKNTHYFIDIPAEDMKLIQAFSECGFRLTETRLHYALANIASYTNERYEVRNAAEQDIENLRSVVIKMRNPFDRLHADIAFSCESADAYLATYIENSVRGFADLVLVPAEGNGPPDGFITSSFPVHVIGEKVAKLGAAAVSRETRKGWLKKLISETIYALKERETDYILVNTQAPNRITQVVLDSFGFKIVYITHIFSKFVR